MKIFRNYFPLIAIGLLSFLLTFILHFFGAFSSIESKIYEQRINDLLYPKLNEIYATSGFSKLSSKHLNIKSRELKINPDHDQDIIQNLFNLFATSILSFITFSKLPVALM